jgi:transposase
MARLPFVRHLSVSKLRYKYRACRHPTEKPRWHALWLLARTDEPRTPAAVADLVGLSAVTVRHVLHRWNDHGPEGVADRRRNNGADPKLTARRQDALYAALQKRPPDGGLWTGPKVARYVRDRWRVSVRPETGWRWLVDLGFSLQVPRPSHPRSADRPTRRAWKKTCDDG